MIILSVGMPRAGSGWHYNLIQDLVIAGGGKNAREVRKKFHLEKILTEVNCNISALTLRRLFLVLPASLSGNSFVIKAHSGATAVGDLFIKMGWMRAVYIYRDPRDAMLSAMDFGKRTLDKGHPNAFSHLTDLDIALDFILKYCVVWESWISRKSILSARYEDLLNDYDNETTKLMDFIHLDKRNQIIADVIEKYRPGLAKEGKDGLHFFKGQIGRFRDHFSLGEQTRISEKLAPYLEKMGYKI